MRDFTVERQKWEELHKDWVFANQAARKARRAITGKFASCANGTGKGPTVEELEEVDRLEKLADEASLASSTYVRQVFS